MMQKIISLIFLISLISLSKCDYRDHLNQFLHGFEELSKEHIYVEHVNNLTSITAMRLYVRIEFPDRVFHASLQPHVDLFHPELVVKNSQGKSSISIHEYLEGKLVDDPLSRVMLHIKDGIATGSIETSDQEKFFIEPSHRHVKEPHDFHMIAYKLSHVKFNFSKPDEDSGHFCGHESHSGEKGFSEQDFDFMLPKSDSYLEDGFEYARRKRAADIKNRCSLALIGDYKFFEEVNDGEEANTINYMISLVQNIDPLYRRQSMDPSGSDEYKGFGFSIKHIEVVTSPDEDDDDSDSYRYYDSPTSRRDVSGLLKAFAFGEWSNDYCLAHLFTNYDFSGGVLGLAYVASPSPSRVGGICTKTYRDATGRYKHLNVGLTTVQNYGRTLLTSEIVFVTGHEFGHNWGSSHDSDTYPECAPSNNRYMMYPAAVDGSQPNNEYFSPCSIRSIHDVLVRKSDSCFTPAASAVCGNGFVEVGEECDPGMQDTACCESCKLTAGSKCEDLNDVCCKNCVYNSGAVCLETKWESGDSKLCTNDHTCQLNTDNNKYECVPGSNVVDGTSCYDNGSCRNGVCQDVCTYNSKLPCMCEGDNICRQCCKDSADAECEIFGGGDLLADGKMCGNGNCVQGKCEVGPQDIQEKFWDVIDRISVNAILLWFRNNVVFAVILFTSIFWIPISIFVDWLDDKYDLGVMDDILGSSNAERKPKTATGGTFLLQERKSVESKPSNPISSPPFLYPKIDSSV